MEAEKGEQAMKMNGSSHVESTSRGNEGPSTALSDLEMQDQMDQFVYIMQQKFLTGEDHEHLDYSKIDDDETLDDHWLREASHDAEEKYFAED
ncbi:hypothetical protein CRG98_032746 [Punica granatum]|nr:hypothetical protein CRG98_032746 [Punica granatum]